MSRMPTNRLPCGHPIQHSDGEGCRLCKTEAPPSFDWKVRAQALETIICEVLHWGARRYFEGRSTAGVHAFNEATRTLLALGVPLNPTADGTVWARDGMGRGYDGLTEGEAAEGESGAYGQEPHP